MKGEVVKNLTDIEIAKLKDAGSQKEWDNIVDEIVTERDGVYLSDWSRVFFGRITPKYLLNQSDPQ